MVTRTGYTRIATHSGHTEGVSTRLRPSRHRAWPSDQQTAKSQQKAQQEANKKLTKNIEYLENISGNMVENSSQNLQKSLFWGVLDALRGSWGPWEGSWGPWEGSWGHLGTQDQDK